MTEIKHTHTHSEREKGREWKRKNEKEHIAAVVCVTQTIEPH